MDLLKFKDKYLKLVIISGLIIIIDQITKLVILRTILPYHFVTVIPGFFNLTHIHNPGGAFGFLANQNSATFNIFFIIVSLSAICFVFYLYIKTPKTEPLLAAGFALILGGAIGNLIDRIGLGIVVDFLDFYAGNLHWPAFNIADSAISIGIIIFLFHIILRKAPV